MWIIKCHLHGFDTKSGLKSSKSICKKQCGVSYIGDWFAHRIWHLHKLVSIELGQHDASGQCTPCKSNQMDKQFYVNHLPMCQLVVFDFPLRAWYLPRMVWSWAQVPDQALTHPTKDANWIFLFLAANYTSLLLSVLICIELISCYSILFQFFRLIYSRQRKNDTNHLHWSTDQQIYWLDWTNLRRND